jgi:hypothetical protein
MGFMGLLSGNSRVYMPPGFANGRLPRVDTPEARKNAAPIKKGYQTGCAGVFPALLPRCSLLKFNVIIATQIMAYKQDERTIRDCAGNLPRLLFTGSFVNIESLLYAIFTLIICIIHHERT